MLFSIFFFFLKGLNSHVKSNICGWLDRVQFDISPRLKTGCSFIKDNHTNGETAGQRHQTTAYLFVLALILYIYQIKLTWSIDSLACVFACIGTTNQASPHCHLDMMHRFMYKPTASVKSYCVGTKAGYCSSVSVRDLPTANDTTSGKETRESLENPGLRRLLSLHKILSSFKKVDPFSVLYFTQTQPKTNHHN